MHCQTCKATENLMVLSTRNTKKFGIKKSYVCRKCNTDRHIRYRATPEGKKRTFDAVYRANIKHKHKVNARMLLNYHLKKGNIIKPSECECCKQLIKLEGHHDDYTKPIEVKWFCRPCHFAYHKLHPEIK